MARKYELTWQRGSEGRSGRWRKKYRGKVYYFEGGTGKTDRAAYDRALEEWKKLKAELDDEAVKPYAADYEAAIAEWEAVQTWSVRHGDQENAKLARTKIKELRARLAGSEPAPLAYGDRFLDRFGWPTSLLEEIGQLIPSPLPYVDGISDRAVPESLRIPPLDQRFDGGPMRIMREVWQDRIAAEDRQSDNQVRTVETEVARFLAEKEAQVGIDLSAGRYANLSLQLAIFRDFAGGANPITAVNGETLAGFRTELLGKIKDKEMSPAYAKDRLNAAKQFVRWLWSNEVLDRLPRNLEALKISTTATKVTAYSVADVKQLLGATQGPMRLYILLALNCGMTQIDIAELRMSEVDWKRGRITKRRTKTRKHQTPPTVSYKLWRETFQLLNEYKASEGDRVLLNEHGRPLKIERLREDGKLHKIDNIGRSFARLCNKLKWKDANFKRLRKTSPSLLMGTRYSGLRTYFLGNAPHDVTDRHYTDAPEKTLDDVIGWLGKQYGIK